MYKNLNTGVLGVRTNLETTVAMAKRHGFAGVDFSIQEVAQLGVDHARRLFDAAGVRPGAWSLPVDWRGDEAAYQEQLAGLPSFAATAQQLGALRTSTWIPSSSKERDFAENFAFHVTRFRPIAAALRDHGCRLGLEFIGPETLRLPGSYPFIYTAEGMLELCRAIGTGNVGLLLDCFHWYTSDGTAATLDALQNDDVVVVHVNDAPAGVPAAKQIDNQRTLPGETGVIDIVTFLHALRRMQYDGPVTVEPFSARVRAMAPEAAVAATAESLRVIWSRAGLT